MAFVSLEYNPEGGSTAYRMELCVNSLEHAVDRASNYGDTFPKAFATLMDWYVEQMARRQHSPPIRVKVKGPVPREEQRLLERFAQVHELLQGRAVDPRRPPQAEVMS
jgi:hypothetical protein